MSHWGREFMWPDDSCDYRQAWLSREAVPDEAEARRLAVIEVGEPEAVFVLKAVLMREESEVEARINGHEFPCMVECTPRARSPEPFWRVEWTEE